MDGFELPSLHVSTKKKKRLGKGGAARYRVKHIPYAEALYLGLDGLNAVS